MRSSTIEPDGYEEPLDTGRSFSADAPYHTERQGPGSQVRSGRSRSMHDVEKPRESRRMRIELNKPPSEANGSSGGKAAASAGAGSFMLEAGDQDTGECWLSAFRDASYSRLTMPVRLKKKKNYPVFRSSCHSSRHLY